MFYWYPIVKDLPIPQPRTILIRHEDAWKGHLSLDPLDGKPDPAFDKMIAEAEIEADKMGYPVFIRSDEYSGKHSWKNTCFIARREDIHPHVAAILEEIEMLMIVPFFGIAVREFWQLDWKFLSHEGMPVSCERRFFVKDGTYQCSHPYWPPASIQNPSIENWLGVLNDLQKVSREEMEILVPWAELVGKTLGGYWSIDFCRRRSGQWGLTDMALGEDSYHWATCEYAPPEMLKQYGDPEAKPKDLMESLKDFLI